MKVWVLKRFQFDSLENHNPVSEDLFLIFKSRELLLEWIQLIGTKIVPYLGYNNQLYPCYKIEEKEVIDKERPEKKEEING